MRGEVIICEGVREMLERVSSGGQHIPAKLNYFDNAKKQLFIIITQKKFARQ